MENKGTSRFYQWEHGNIYSKYFQGYRDLLRSWETVRDFFLEVEEISNHENNIC